MTPSIELSESGFGPARPEDCDALVAIESYSTRPWSAGAFAAEIENRPPTIFVLRDSGTVVAFAVARFLGSELDVVNMAVDKGRRRAGFGRLILRHLLDHGAARGSKTAFLETRAGNHAGRELYGSAGFMEMQRRPNFYNDPVEDAILMRFEMEPPQG